MVYYYVAKDTRSIEHPYSNLVLETFLRARWSETDDDSWSLETLNDRGIHNYSQKKEKSAVHFRREILSFGRDYFDPSDENNKFTVPINP